MPSATFSSGSLPATTIFFRLHSHTPWDSTSVQRMGSIIPNGIFTRTFSLRCFAPQPSGNSWLVLSFWECRSVTSPRRPALNACGQFPTFFQTSHSNSFYLFTKQPSSEFASVPQAYPKPSRVERPAQLPPLHGGLRTTPQMPTAPLPVDAAD